MNIFFSLLRLATYICLIGWVGTYFMINRLPPPTLIDPALYPEPVQTTVLPKKFTLLYKDNPVYVVPMADYDITGLVVSHNEPTAWYVFDISHDKESPDTRDLCVLWGSNVQNEEYRKISFFSGDYTCNWKWGANTDVSQFSMYKISNNHLITDSDEIRTIISQVNIGDQIHITGKLVNYSEDRWNGAWRRTSLTRTDTGMGACEIIFVQSISILHSYNGEWAKLHRLMRNGFAGLLLLRFVLLFTPLGYRPLS